MPMTTSPARTHRSRYLGLALALLLMEVLVATRLAHLRIIRGSLGDFLFVILIYCLVQTVRPIRPSRLAMAVLAFSSLVEVAQAFHLASRLGLMPGDLGYVLLGNTFSLLDIGMYAAGCTTALMLDVRVIHPPGSAPPGRHQPQPSGVLPDGA